MSAQSAVTFTREKNFERDAVVGEREIMRDALRRSMGDATLTEIRAQFDRRIRAGEFIEIEKRMGRSDRAFTTQQMIDLERDTIQMMRDGQSKYAPLASVEGRSGIERNHEHLSKSQLRAVEQIVTSRDQVTALEGVAGAGKTTSLSAIREAAEREGYKVEGFAPTSRAAQKLAEPGITSSTLQRHLLRDDEQRDARKRLYVLDESSSASTKQMNEFLQCLREDDCVLLVVGTRQHQAVEAGTPYQQLQEAGVQTVRLDEIVLPKDSTLKEVVEHLSRGHVQEAMENLDAQGRVHEIVDRDERLQAIAAEYANQPDGTLVISPDNKSRIELNRMIHSVLQEAGQVDHREHRLKVLVARQEITGADRQWANQYEPGDFVRYTRGSKGLCREAGEYARVERVNVGENLIPVRRENGQYVSYDPRRLHGVTLYRETERKFAKGDRAQFTAPNRHQHIANRELGTIEKIDARGNLQVRLDSGRTLAFNIKENRHLYHGYVVTSHSSQAQTADRVLIHIDTEQAGEKLINRRLAYVAVSRARHDAQIFTNDRGHLAEQLSRDVSHRSAIEPTRESVPAHGIGQSLFHEPKRKNTHRPQGTASADHIDSLRSRSRQGSGPHARLPVVALDRCFAAGFLYLPEASASEFDRVLTTTALVRGNGK